MKISLKAIAVAVALSAGLAGNASAMVSQPEVAEAVRSVIAGGSQVQVLVNGNTATLVGSFDDAGVQFSAIQAAMNVEGIDRVIDHTFGAN